MGSKAAQRPGGTGQVLQAIGAFGVCASAATPVLAQEAVTDQTVTTDHPNGASGTSVSQVVVTGLRPLLGDKIPLTVQNTPQSVNLCRSS